METYDRIMVFNEDGKECETCMGAWQCHKWKKECSPSSGQSTICPLNRYIYYTNINQLKGLIEEAESGYHKWVRENTMFVCEHYKSCQIDPCTLRGEGIEYLGGKMDCKRSDRTIKLIPYRGDKSEKATWHGRTDDAQDLCKNINQEKLAADVCSVLANHMIKAVLKESTDENCSEVEAFPKWGDDGYGCITCKSSSVEYGCHNARIDSCGISMDYCRYERKEGKEPLPENARKHRLKRYLEHGEFPEKEGRSDENYTVVEPTNFISPKWSTESEYNQGKQFLKEKAVEMAGDIVEYVVLKQFALCDLEDINDKAFREMYRRMGLNKCLLEGQEIVNFKEASVTELLRLGFIKKKVNDIELKPGDMIKELKSGFIFMVAFIRKELITRLICLNTGSFCGDPCGKFNIGEGTSHLSDYVGKNRLPEFTPCKVKITEVK